MSAFLLALVIAAVNAAALGAPRVAGAPDQPPPVSSVQAPDQLDAGSDDKVWRVHTARKEIALTFDDGPYPFYTPVLLHVLDRSHVPATFFIVGRSAQEFPELVTRIVDAGDEVGNHTFNHYTLTTLSDAQIAYQIAAGGAFLEQFTGKPLSLFRPPHGHCNAHILAIARALGYRTILWSDAANDVKDISPDVIARRVEAEASPGGIILLHSGQYRTIEALPRIIDRLRAQGYTFVTVSKLLDDGEAP
jgi:peptidoglycan-N-acetylglucosamine deacetylase